MSKEHPGEDSLIAYVLDEVDIPERAGIESHLGECAACGETVFRLSSAVETYRESGDDGAPAGVLIDLLEAQAATRDRMAMPWWRLKPVFASASIALVALLFLSGFWAGRSSAPAGPQAHTRVEERAEIPWPLPVPPVIDFQAERPLSVRFALAGDVTRMGAGTPEEREGLRDSL